MGAINSTTRTFRWTVGKWSKETGWGIFLWIIIGRILKWHWRRVYVIVRHHPAAAGILTAGFVVLILSPLILLGATLGLCVATGVLRKYQPDQYRTHIDPRLRGTLKGVGHRFRLRRKLQSCGLIDKDDPTPLPVRTRVHGCTTELLLKMVHGQELEWYRVRSARIAQTMGALECTANPYRVGTKTKPRYVQLELLAKDPFTSHFGPEYIDFHQTDTLSPAVATHRSGQPHQHNLAAHRLRVAMTRWGKSNAIRAMIYAQRHNIKAGLLELWGIDGKGGVEQSHLEHAFAYVAYGDSQANQHSYNPAEFDALLKAAVKVLKRRQRDMRGTITEHKPTPEQPWLLIVIDELLVLTSKSLHPDLKNSIAGSLNLILQQGIACGVTIDASTQLAQKELLDRINRDGFTELELGKAERNAVDMLFGTGWWERGARADEIPKDLKGTFYKKTDSTLVPEQIRYPSIPTTAMTPKNLGVTVDHSVLWKRHLEVVPDPEPEPEREPVIIGTIEDEPIQLIAGAAEPQPVGSGSKKIPPTIGGFA